MFFSVLMPVYNVEKFIRQSIDSVLSQDGQDFELILCDDGSTDSSGRICDEYAMKYSEKIRVIHKQNEGLLLTRRRAIQAAKGDWIVHLDSDDYMMPGSLKAIRNTAEKNNADLVIYKIIYGQENKTDISKQSELPFYDGQIFQKDDIAILQRQLILGGYMTSLCQKSVKREIMDIDKDYSDFKNVSLAEDYLQSLPILSNARCGVFLDRACIYYRINTSSITKLKGYSTYKRNFYSIFDANKEAYKYAKSWQFTMEETAYMCASHLRSLGQIIRKMDETCNCRDKEDYRFFLSNLAISDFWNEEFKLADKKKLGKVTWAICWLIKNKQFELLHLFFSIS